MKNALGKLDRKFLIFASCLIGIPLLLILVLMIIKGCSNVKTSYGKYENKMITATKKYIKNEDALSKGKSNYYKVDLETLVTKGYIKSTEKLLDDDSCHGYVVFRINGQNLDEDIKGYENYTVDLECKNYKTNNLKNLVMEDLTTSESGLYKVNGSYIFKGEQVDNYIKIYGTTYRIVSIDKDGLAKLLKEEPETQHIYWDMKYNTTVSQPWGKNIYKDSYIREKLESIYNDSRSTKNSLKSKMVDYDLCVDNISINDTNIYKTDECKDILSNQRYTLLDVTDFAKASLDPECKDITSKSCKNYNYMNRIGVYTWTYNGVLENSYQAYYIENGPAKVETGNIYYTYNLVMHIDSNEKIKSGKGTKKEPYIIDK